MRELISCDSIRNLTHGFCFVLAHFYLVNVVDFSMSFLKSQTVITSSSLILRGFTVLWKEVSDDSIFMRLLEIFLGCDEFIVRVILTQLKFAQPPQITRKKLY